MATTNTKCEEVNIRDYEQKSIKIRIVGDSPLIVHNWSEKAKREMYETQTGKAKTKKKPCKMPFDDFARALYWITPMPTELIKDPCNGEEREVVTEDLFSKAIKDGAKFGFPVISFKKAGNSAAVRREWVKNATRLREAYFIDSEYGELTEIKGDIPQLREDVVKVGGASKSADLRYRPIFEHWYCDLVLRINAGYGMTADDIINVVNAGGSGPGVGEWRPEKNGIYGKYHVEIIER